MVLKPPSMQGVNISTCILAPDTRGATTVKSLFLLTIAPILPLNHLLHIPTNLGARHNKISDTTTLNHSLGSILTRGRLKIRTRTMPAGKITCI
jgi:hypothetical protein